MLILWLLVLAALWAAVLIHMFRTRAEGHRADSIGDFRYRLGVIGRTGGHAFRRPAPLRSIAPPAVRPLPGTPRPVSHTRRVHGMTPVQRRRRDVLVTLLCASGGSLLLAFASGVTIMWVLHLVADVFVFLYVGLLLHVKNVAAERHAKVHYLPRRTAPPLTSLRRTGSF
ncbi:MAG: hypothetical protein U0V73_00785 [Acidimicrobiia bacterium]